MRGQPTELWDSRTGRLASTPVETYQNPAHRNALEPAELFKHTHSTIRCIALDIFVSLIDLL